ncbi:MAG TPA: alpha-amylase family glycosyl hydrolase, partial [Longimicrobium sp.]|nr:alpha-amylase family glycosyl hydrolase [Longimicrobium sp.]
HLPGTHVFLRDYAAHVARVKPDAYTVGEVWDSIGAIMPYYPDQLTSHFMFQLSDDVLTAARTGSAANLYRGYLRLQQEGLPPHRYAPFLRNHDQSRTMTVLEGDDRKAKLAAALLLTLPGMPFLYYGEEIGIAGDKPDENLRTPMHWTSSTGGGFTTGTAWRAPQADWATRTVAAQDADPNSLLSLHRRLIHLRKANSALAVGTLVPLTASSDAVAAFVRRDGDRAVLVVANLGATPLSGVTLSSPAGALPAGNGPGNNLLGGPDAARLSVGADGRIQGYVPFRTLAPMSVHVLEFTSPCP